VSDERIYRYEKRAGMKRVPTVTHDRHMATTPI
jgi:hypothetical protein